jgi:hypothetical protein
MRLISNQISSEVSKMHLNPEPSVEFEAVKLA